MQKTTGQTASMAHSENMVSRLSERELLLSRIKNLVIGSAISAAALLLGILVHIDFIAIPALLILAGSLSGLLSHLLQLRRLK